MKPLSEFNISNNPEYAQNWFNYRFGGTFGVLDGEIVQVNELQVDEDGRFLLHCSDSDGDFPDTHEIDPSDLLVGVPRHGYINTKGGAAWLPLQFFDKYKWGWQPESDTSNRHWKGLIQPGLHKKIPLELELLNIALTYDYALIGKELVFRNYLIIGEFNVDAQGVPFVKVPIEHDFAVFDEDLCKRVRIEVS